MLHSVAIYVGFWGTEWQSNAAATTYVDGFFTDLGGSAWAATMGQYCSGVALNASSCPGGAGSILNPLGQLKGAFIDTSAVPTVPTTANIRSEAAAVAAHFGNPAGALYMIYTPSGKSESGFGTSWCAYHSWAQSGSTLIPYGYMPYQPDAGYSCGASSVAGPFDGFSIVGGHEYAEAVTDPFPSSTPGYTGWNDPTLGNGEIGDKCAWTPSPGNVTMNGHLWPVQTLFSNMALAQSQPPCVFSGTIQAPNPPTAVTATAGNAQATVHWTAPANNGGAVISGYRITPYLGVAAQTPMSTGLVTSLAVTGLSNGALYTFTVAALNSVGTSLESNTSNAVTPATLPGRPTGVVAIGGSGQASLTWTSPVDNGGSAILSYTVNCSPACMPVVVGGSSLQVVVFGLPAGQAITFSVIATNSVGPGLPSVASGAITLRSSAGQTSGGPLPSRSPANQSTPGASPPPRA